MSLNLIRVLAAVVALVCVVAGAAVVWPTMARSTGSQAFMPQAVVTTALMTSADFDHAFASVAEARRESIPAFLAMIDYERVVVGETAMLRHEPTPVIPTAADFEAVFDSVTLPRRDNTPPIREKLRNAGWKRILGSS